jgi:cytochrome c oxidase cbb3-type subunit III
MFGGGGAPSRVPPTTVTVTLANKQQVKGRLVRIDDFLVTLTTDEGAQRTYSLENGNATAQIHDPLIGHRNLLATYADKDIHNVTAYLVTIK